jgi:hypothetical protein
MNGFNNLCYYVERAKEGDKVDYNEGLDAYYKYNKMMQLIADKYNISIYRVTAAFCALSPNSDYFGNLRSTISCIEGIQNKQPSNKITVSTYNHCKLRAMNYLHGWENFNKKGRGLKILNFYKSILEPDSPYHCTIDGHMVAAYKGDPTLNMKQALVNKRGYEEIKSITSKVAKQYNILPSQAQAIIWFSRKRLHKIKYNPIPDLFTAPNDKWGILIDLDTIKPYENT